MSPEKDFISAFLDGEVPSPWKERLEKSIEQDSRFRALYESHAEVHRLLGELPEPDFAEARSRVWEKLQESIESAPLPVRAGHRPGNPVPVWRRRVAVPLPVAVAAAAIVVVFAAFTIFRFVEGSGSNGAVMAQSVEGLNVTVNVKDVEQLLDILNGQNKIREVKIELPEPHQFKLMGEPLLLRASDTSGGFR